MALSLYLVNPAADFPTYYGAEILAGSGMTAGAAMADLATATVAALAPADADITICDEAVAPVDFDHPAEWIALTGKSSQRQRMIAIATEFRRRGKRVLIGGPFASLVPEAMRPHCDVLVRGEIEGIAAELFADLGAGRPKPEYVGDRPDLATSPRPRWDLYPNARAVVGALQTSRGCPFECEFCDVIQYLGRKQRHKPIASVIEELEILYRHGYASIFLADDNFTVHRRRCRDLLQAIAEWRRTRGVSFITQVSIDAARDLELLDLCAAAGVTQVFIGIETPNEASLKEAKKRQNLHIDLAEEVQAFVDRGIAVFGGMVVGFDADGPDVFDVQHRFAMATAVPVFSIGSLMAPEATPLYERMQREGRIIAGHSDVQVVPWTSNIEPLAMSSDELHQGMRRLCNALYSPEAFGERVLRFAETFGRRAAPFTPAPERRFPPQRPISHDVGKIAAATGRRLTDEAKPVWLRVWATTARRPFTIPFVRTMLFRYAQLRFMFEQEQFWDGPAWHANGTERR